MCRSLLNMAAHGDLRVPIIDNGGNRILLNTLRNHPSAADTSVHAMSALGRIAACDHAQLTKLPAVIPLALGAIRRRPNDASVQQSGFKLVRLICAESENCKQQFMKADDVTLLLMAMRAYSDRQIHAARTLRMPSLTPSSPDGVPRR
jgi:hypothetical protein